MSSERPYRRERRQAVTASLLLLLAYFVVPVEPDVNGLRLALRTVGTALLVLGVARLVTGEVRRQLVEDTEPTSVWHLTVALVAGVLTFALGDYVISISDPAQFVNLRTRIDALYFTLATLTTIGYGDVHAQGQLARVAVCAQMIFSIGIIATGASLAVKQLTERPPAPPPPQPPGSPPPQPSAPPSPQSPGQPPQPPTPPPPR